MKTIILILFLGLLGNPQTGESNLDPVIEAYMNVKDALVKNDSQNASEGAHTLLTAVEGYSFQSPDLTGAVKKMAGTQDLEKQRASFVLISSKLWDTVKKSAFVQNILYYQYCPMKKAYWLSTEPEIRNPYYGNKMLNCGTITDQKNN